MSAHQWQRAIICFRTRMITNCFWHFHSQGMFTVEHSIQTALGFWTSYPHGKILSERNLNMYRVEKGCYILGFRGFEADILPKYNPHIFPTLTKLICDEQLCWARIYSTNPLPHWNPLHEQVPLKVSVFRGDMWPHQESGINQTNYPFIATWDLNSQTLTLERQVIGFYNICP